jgi:YebC/PmpR family DNA-binding regulatory protein
MPKETIERAISKASQDKDLKEELYEGYGPGGVALLVRAATDNPNRTVSQIKQVLERGGGSMASPGAVSYLFERKGVILFPAERDFTEIFDIAAEYGAEDVLKEEGSIVVLAPLVRLKEITRAFEEKGILIETLKVIDHPKATLLSEIGKREEVESLVRNIEDLDDILSVETNLEEA